MVAIFIKPKHFSIINYNRISTQNNSDYYRRKMTGKSLYN